MLKKIFSHKQLSIFLLGFASGFPLLLTGSTLQAWTSDSGVDIKLVGALASVGLPYTLKFLWAPIIDRFELFGHKRKGWMILFQLLIALALFALSLSNPQESMFPVVVCAFCVTFFSASLDINIDAYRREILAEDELGLGSAMYVNGYRIAMLVSGAFALFMADQMIWKYVYQIMSLIMATTILFTIFAPKENHDHVRPRTIGEAVIGPFVEFFNRKGAFIILLFILLYKVGDTMCANMTTSFILKTLVYSKTEMAIVAKTFGMIATILGGTLGGVLLIKWGVKKGLIIFGIFQALSTVGFALLTHLPHDISSLAMVIGFENLTSGLGTSAYSAYMASMTNKKFTATQYALLSSLMGVPRVIAATPTGFLFESWGPDYFFIFCALVALPGLLLIKKIEDNSPATV